MVAQRQQPALSFTFLKVMRARMDLDAKDVRFLKGLFSLIPGTPASCWHKVINELREARGEIYLNGFVKDRCKIPNRSSLRTMRHRNIFLATFADWIFHEFKTPTTRNNPDPAEQGISVYGDVTPTRVREKNSNAPSHIALVYQRKEAVTRVMST